MAVGKELTPEKAKEILRDGVANGRPLTSKQRGFFGARAGGSRTSTSSSAAGAPIRGVKRGKSFRTRSRPR